MNPLNPFFAIIIYCIAFFTAYLISLKYKIANTNNRYENIDGLRGFLALGVFIHHASIWHQYLQINSWESPKSYLYGHFGQTSVSFFFMITAFLFITKLINNGDKIFDWNSLYISRIFRIVPMYLVSISVLIMIVMIISNWKLNIGIFAFIRQLFYWGTFTVISCPKINGLEITNIINAGVVWSLPYEWLFYLCLPLFALFILKKKPSYVYLVFSILFIFIFYRFREFYLEHVLSFLGGAIAPFIIKYGPKKVNYNSIFITFIVLICFFSILLFESSTDPLCKLLIAIVFNLIALGNSIFGILKSSILKFLGEISYSTYLIHGILIFIVMYFGFGFKKVAYLTPLEYCITIFFLTPFLIIISSLTYRFIEKPGMNLSKKMMTNKINHPHNENKLV